MRSATIFNFLIEANLMASIAILLMIPLRKLLRKQMGNSVICFGWLLIAIRLLCPVSLPNPIIHEIRPANLNDAAIRPIAGQIKVRIVDAISDVGLSLFRRGDRQGFKQMQKVAAGVDYNGYPEILAWILMIGMVVIFCWFIFRNIRFRMILRKNRIAPVSSNLQEMYLTLCKERKVKPVPVYFTDPVPGACLVGVFRPYIVLPVMTAPQDVVTVLTHEICHLKNRDHIWNILRLLCCIIHWFNPLVWIAASMSRSDSELRCDDRVTSLMNDQERKSYAGVLVLAAARKSIPGIGVMATGMTMNGKRLKNRIVAIVQQTKPLRWLTVSFIVLASMCLAVAFCTGEWNPGTVYAGVQDETVSAHDVPIHDERLMPGDIQSLERGIWTIAGYDDYDEISQFRDITEEHLWASAGTMLKVTYADSNRLDRYCTFAEDGTLLELQDLNVPWLGEDLPESRKYVRDDVALQEISDHLMAFLEKVNPGMGQTVDHFSVMWESEQNGQIWMQVDGAPKDEKNGEWITFVVRLEPEWQLQYFACVSNG